MMKRAIIIEVVCLITVLILTLVIQVFVLSKIVKNGTLDINLHDTYFVISTGTLTSLNYVITGFLVYLIRAAATVFKSQRINTISVVFTVCAILLLSQLGLEFASWNFGQEGGFTIYPPLSALPAAPIPSFDYFFSLFRVFTLIKVALIAYLCFVSVRVGMGIGKNAG